MTSGLMKRALHLFHPHREFISPRRRIPEADEYRRLIELSGFIRGERDPNGQAKLLCEAGIRLTGAQGAGIYAFAVKNESPVWLSRIFMMGSLNLPQRLPARKSYIELLKCSGDSVIQLSPEGPFPAALAGGAARSALAVHILAAAHRRLLLLLQSRLPYHFTGAHIELIEELARFDTDQRGESNG
jgi:hypothetical protein